MDAVGRYSNRTNDLKRLRRIQRLERAPAKRSATAAPRIHAVKRRLDDRSLRQLISDYVSGDPTTVLMERYNLGKGTVLGILRRSGIELRNQGLKPGDLRRAIALYESGQSLTRVADQMACDAETIRQALKAAGIAIRKPWDRPHIGRIEGLA